MIKSQDELNTCNDGKRSSDVLVATIEKCERLQKQLDMAVWTLRNYASESYYSIRVLDEWSNITEEAKITLEQIKEIEK